jgi:hypothetical protein
MRYLKNNFQGKKGERIPHDLLNTLANFWNDLTVMGGTLRRRSDGRNTVIDITPTAVTTDTEGFSAIKNPAGRMTLEPNPETYPEGDDNHTGELQLHNVHQVREWSSSIPFFESFDLRGAGENKVEGELYWAQADSKRYDYGHSSPPYEPSYKSIDIANTYSDTTKGKWNLGIYGFTASGTCTVPYSTHAIVPGVHTDKELTWRVPVTLGSNAYPDYAGSPGTADLISTVAADTGSTTHYAKISLKKRVFTVANGCGNLDATETPLSGFNAPVILDILALAQAMGYTNHNHAHNDLSSGSASLPSWSGTNTGHDARYLTQTGTGLGTWATNRTGSIGGDVAGKFGINFVNGQLMREDGAAASVDYKNTHLYSASGTKTVDWSYGILYKPALAGGWVTDTNCGFYVGSGGNFEVYNGKTSLTCTSGTDALKLTTGATGSPTLQIHATAESSVPVVYLDNIRLMIGRSTASWIGFEATAGQLRIVDNTGAELAKFTTGDPG